MTTTAATDIKKVKTPASFVVFLALACLFSCTQYIVPLEHVSTDAKLQVSKDSFTRRRQEIAVAPNGTKASHLRQQQPQAKDEPAQQSKIIPENKQKDPRPDYHVVFSTSCSDQQNWESYVFFYHAFKVGQPGNVTRIASACTAQQAKEQTDFFHHNIRPLSDSFHLHLTPDYGNVAKAKGSYYKYMNKPYGLRHWMEHVLGMRPDTMQTVHHDKGIEDGIVILMDPDMILLRPILHDFSDTENYDWAEEQVPPSNRTVVRHGHPMAQQDGYLTNSWMFLKYEHVFNATTHQPIPKQADGPLHWNTGPPYLATVRDMYRIAVKWTEYAPRVVEIHPELFAEMFGFIFATVELQLPFTLVKSIVVSVTTSQHREGWKFVDDLAKKDVCSPPETALLPVGLHYCKRYALGKWFFSKYRLKKNIMNCEKGLLKRPPLDLALHGLDYAIFPPRADGKDKDTYVEKHELIKFKKQRKREAFMLCGLTRSVNEAMAHLKRHACGNHGNFSETYTIYDDPTNF